VARICDDSGTCWTIFKLSWNLVRLLKDVVQISNIWSEWKAEWERECNWRNTTFAISCKCNWSSLDKVETLFGVHIQHRAGCDKCEKSLDSSAHQRRLIIAVCKLYFRWKLQRMSLNEMTIVTYRGDGGIHGLRVIHSHDLAYTFLNVRRRWKRFANWNSLTWRQDLPFFVSECEFLLFKPRSCAIIREPWEIISKNLNIANQRKKHHTVSLRFSIHATRSSIDR
jgi:hypothetical protein